MAQIPAPVLPPAPRPLPVIHGGGGPEISPEDVQMLMAAFGPKVAMEKPTFDVSDLYPKREEAPADLPLDLRPLAQFTDALYGTRTATNMPDYRSRAIEEQRMLKALDENNAVKQTEAQARLASFKEGLGQYYKQNDPGEKLKQFDLLMKAMGRGGDEELRIQKAQYKLATDEAKMQADYAKNMNNITDKQRDVHRDLMTKARKEENVTNYDKIRGSTGRIRNAFYSAYETGIPDYGVIIQYIKALDPPSTVMKSEAESAEQAQSVWQRLKNYDEKIRSGSFLGPEAERDIIRLAETYENLSKKAFNRTIKSYEDEAALQNLPSGSISGPLSALQAADPEFFTFQDEKGETYRVRDDRVEAFKEKFPGAKPVRLKSK